MKTLVAKDIDFAKLVPGVEKWHSPSAGTVYYVGRTQEQDIVVQKENTNDILSYTEFAFDLARFKPAWKNFIDSRFFDSNRHFEAATDLGNELTKFVNANCNDAHKYKLTVQVTKITGEGF